jgi:hypothetical protein
LPGNHCPSGDRDSHPTLLLLPPGSAIPTGLQDLTALLLPNRDALLPDCALRRSSGVSAAGFRPVHLRGPKPRRVSCYAFFKGWLLLSLPPRCFGLTTPFDLSLSQHFGALTPVWVVPLSEHELNPCIPSPGFHGAGVFGVQKRGEGSLLRASRLVLYPAGSLTRGYAATYFGGN